MADSNEPVDKPESVACAASSSSGNEASSTTVVTEPTPEKDLVVEAVEHFQQGKRHMIVSDFRSAVTSFEQAVKLLDSCYGTGAVECGEAYLQYGIALFEQSRLEEGIMDGMVKVDGQNEDAEDEEDEGEQQEEDAELDSAEQPIVEESEGNEAEAKSSPETVPEEKIDIDLTQPSTSKGESATSNGDKSDEEEEADNPTNVEIAWEVLTLAQEIFSRESTKENRLNLAETLQKLAEISIEWENNENAIYLLNECLELRKEILKPDDRLIAVAYHYLGIAFSFKCDYDNANSCFESALGVIELRIKHLKEKNTAESDQFEKDANGREITQLEDLIPELRGKSDDMKEQMQSQFKTLESLEKETEQEESKQAKLQTTPDKPVNNISHLIKRKTNDSETNGAQNGTETNNKKARVDVNSAAVESNPKEAI